ncbi:MAG: DHHA1 domain-containing protein [Lysinibacillus sp.]
MRELLYYKDSMIQSFEAEVIGNGTDNLGQYVVLSNTAFYPTGGGQPHDTGLLNDVAVVNVEKVDNEIRHYVTEGATLSGPVNGQIDWARRFDHMQQHTGQHILTAAFVELFDLPTISFHLGTGLVSIDLQTASITEEQLVAAEKRANEIIVENRPIETKWITADELTDYNLRKDIAVEGDIRLVIIPDYDYNGCGGTHPHSTGAVQAIKIMEIEKMKSNIRIHFVCGQRVLNELAMRKRVLTDVARQLSVPEVEAATATAKVMTNAKSTEKALADTQDKLLEVEATELAKAAIVAVAFENRSIQQLQKLAKMVTTLNPAAVVYLVADNSDKLQFVAVRGADASISMKDVAARALPAINGKGGGSDQAVQGGGEKLVTAEQFLALMQG